jgi:uncharacterized membrane protein YraQ (UPF0718 family)
MMTEAKFIIGLVVAILLSVAVSYFWQDYRSAKQAELQNVSRGRVLENTSATIDDGAIAEAVAEEVDRVLSSSRTEFTDNQTKAKANEPETAHRATRTVPVSVRNNFKQRRLARERFGCVPGECEASDQAGNAPER